MVAINSIYLSVAALVVSQVSAACDKNLKNTIEVCLDRFKIDIDACKSDNKCLCLSYKNSLQCYINCPNEDLPSKGPVKTNLGTYCALANIDPDTPNISIGEKPNNSSNTITTTSDTTKGSKDTSSSKSNGTNTGSPSSGSIAVYGSAAATVVAVTFFTSSRNI